MQGIQIQKSAIGDYDVIGDIHGHYFELDALMRKLGYDYNSDSHIYIHPEGRKPAFMGDYIDRGLYNTSTIDLVRNMTDKGLATGIMGNHEFNAVLYTMEDPQKPGRYLRPHTEKNTKQHETFLKEVESNPKLYADTIQWFKSLPLFTAFNNATLAHACVDFDAMETLIEGGCMNANGVLTGSGWAAAGDKTSPFYDHIESLLKGPEDALPNGKKFIDASGATRKNARIAWWNEKPQTYADAFVSMATDSPFRSLEFNETAGSVSEKIRSRMQRVPQNHTLFIGHIWESGAPKPLSSNTVCVDYSVAKPGGKMAAYRLNQDHTTPDADNFVWVPTIEA